MPQLKTKAPKLSSIPDQLDQLSAKVKKYDDNVELFIKALKADSIQNKELKSTKRMVKMQAKKLKEHAALLKIKDNEIKDLNTRSECYQHNRTGVIYFPSSVLKS